MSRRGLVPLVVSLVLVMGAWLVAGRPPIGLHTVPSRTGLTELRSITQLQARFNADTGTTRLILILSPT